MRPALAAGQHARGQRGSSPARSAEDLPLPDGPTTPSSGAPASRATISATSRSRPKKNVGVVDVERGEALERADDDALRALPFALPRAACSSTTLAGELVLRRAQRRPLGGDALRRLDHRLVRPVQRRVLAQDRLVQAPQLRAGLDADLLDQRARACAVGVERLGLPPAAVEREHALGVQALAQRLLAHQRVELADDLAVAAGGEVALDRELERRSRSSSSRRISAAANGSSATSRERRRRATARAPRARARRASTSRSKPPRVDARVGSSRSS